MALWFAMPGAQGGLPVKAILLLVVILATCFQFTEVFHNAMLASIATPARVGGLSGLGIATGNLGTLTAMIVMLFGVALPASGMTLGGLLPDKPLFGLDPATHEHSRIAGPVAGVWFLIFIVPLLLWTPDRPSTGVSARVAVREGLTQLWLTIKRARRVSNVVLFLLARMLYTDAKVAILAYSGSMPRACSAGSSRNCCCSRCCSHRSRFRADSSAAGWTTGWVRSAPSRSASG